QSRFDLLRDRVVAQRHSADLWRDVLEGDVGRVVRLPGNDDAVLKAKALAEAQGEAFADGLAGGVADGLADSVADGLADGVSGGLADVRCGGGLIGDAPAISRCGLVSRAADQIGRASCMKEC